MIVENSYIIIKMDYNVSEGNNACVTFIYNEYEFIRFIESLNDKYDDFIIFKNGEVMSPYDCKREIEIYEKRCKLWGSYDPFGCK